MALKRMFPCNFIIFYSSGKYFLSNDEKIYFYDTIAPLATGKS